VRTDKLTTAITEARRFLDRASDLEMRGERWGTKAEMFQHSPKTAAVRRASLDLTRALAALRSPK